MTVATNGPHMLRTSSCPLKGRKTASKLIFPKYHASCPRLVYQMQFIEQSGHWLQGVGGAPFLTFLVAAPVPSTSLSVRPTHILFLSPGRVSGQGIEYCHGDPRDNNCDGQTSQRDKVSSRELVKSHFLSGELHPNGTNERSQNKQHSQQLTVQSPWCSDQGKECNQWPWRADLHTQRHANQKIKELLWPNRQNSVEALVK